MPRRLHRSDTTTKALTATARALGAKVIPLNGVVDALILFRGRVLIVDFKSDRKVRKKKATETDSQARLVKEGWPIQFVSTEHQLLDLLGITP